MPPDLNLDMIANGVRALNRGVPFIACNRDESYPGEGGVRFPGCGGIVGALIGASLRQPDHVVGKPSPHILRIVLRRMGARPEECVVFGDSLQADISMAAAEGVASIWIRPPGLAREIKHNGIRPTASISSLREAAGSLRE